MAKWEGSVEDMVKVSVIMNGHNAARYLAEAIESVYGQTFKDWEIILWDNASSDETGAIAQQYDARLRYFRSTVMVPLGQARNCAIEKANGKYIAFLDCDDVWISTKLGKQFSVLEAEEALGAVFTDALFFGKDQKEFRSFPVKKPPQGMIFKDLLHRYFLPMPTIMIRRCVLDHIGGWFDPRFNMVEDADLLMRLAYYFPIAYVDDVLAKRRMHTGSWTSMKKELFPQEETMLLEKFTSLWPLFNVEYSDSIGYRRAMIEYQYAILDWEKGNVLKARQRMKTGVGVIKKMWVPLLGTYFPISFYKLVKKMYKGLTAPFKGSMDDQSF